MDSRDVLLKGNGLPKTLEEIESELARKKAREYRFAREIALRTPPDYIDSVNGHKRWLDENGELHREFDLPAIIDIRRDHEEWWQHGRRWRADDQPHMVTCGDQIWFCDPDPKGRDNVHRNNDLPAIIQADGTLLWYKKNRKHRESGPAVIRPISLALSQEVGRYEFWLDGVRVNEDGTLYG